MPNGFFSSKLQEREDSLVVVMTSFIVQRHSTASTSCAAPNRVERESCRTPPTDLSVRSRNETRGVPHKNIATGRYVELSPRSVRYHDLESSDQCKLLLRQLDSGFCSEAERSECDDDRVERVVDWVRVCPQNDTGLAA